MTENRKQRTDEDPTINRKEFFIKLDPPPGFLNREYTRTYVKIIGFSGNLGIEMPGYEW